MPRARGVSPPGAESRHELVRDGSLDPIPTYLGTELPDNIPAPVRALTGNTRDDALTLRRDGLVPLAVAHALDVSGRAVQRYLGELRAAGEIEPVPGFLDYAPQPLAHRTSASAALSAWSPARPAELRA